MFGPSQILGLATPLSRIDSLGSFVDFYWKIFLAYTSKVWLIWKCLQFSELGGDIAHLATRLATPQIVNAFCYNCIISVQPI